MELLKLRQEYQKQLIRVGVSPNIAQQVAITLSLEELRLIGDIWPDLIAFASQNEQREWEMAQKVIYLFDQKLRLFLQKNINKYLRRFNG